MSDSVQIALIASIGPTVVGLVVAYLNFLNGRKIEQVHVATNSMKDALVQSTRLEAHATGQAEGIASEKAAQALRDQGAKTEFDKA